MLLKNTITALVGLCALAVNAAPYQPVDLRSLLRQNGTRWSNGTTISFPGSQVFINATERWSTYEPPTYFAAVSPATEGDVAKVVKLATSHNVPFLATGRRHGYTTTLSGLKQGLAIDLSQLKSYSIDPASGRVTLGGATSIGDFQKDLDRAGYQIQSGSGTCPGYVGLTVGGGIGRYTGLFGLVLDGLLSARVVTADGRIIEVSSTQEPDLFWGLRGAGANLGIITSATYQAHRQVAGGQVMNADFIFSADKSQQYFDVLASFSGTMPAELAVVTLIFYNPEAQATQILANWVYMGSQEEGLKVIAPVLALNASSTAIKEVPWSDEIDTAAQGINPRLCQTNLSRNPFSANLRKLTASTFQASFEKMADFFDRYPSARSSAIDIETFPNQAMLAVPDDVTAYPFRDTVGYIQVNIQTESQNAPDDPAAIAGIELGLVLRDSWAETSGYDGLRVYVNYARGDESLEQLYGAEKLPRLTALKKKWDPKNVFAFNNALPTS